LLEKARSLLSQLQGPSTPVSLADDILLFFYDLHDNYFIARSSSLRFTAKTFSILGDVIYGLESDPDGTLLNDHWKNFIQLTLEGIATGKIVVGRK
jgi:hypothetical protein